LRQRSVSNQTVARVVVRARRIVHGQVRERGGGKALLHVTAAVEPLPSSTTSASVHVLSQNGVAAHRGNQFAGWWAAENARWWGGGVGCGSGSASAGGV